MSYDDGMVDYEGHPRCNGGPTGLNSANVLKTKGPPLPIEAFKFKCARHSTNTFDEKK